MSAGLVVIGKAEPLQVTPGREPEVEHESMTDPGDRIAVHVAEKIPAEHHPDQHDRHDKKRPRSLNVGHPKQIRDLGRLRREQGGLFTCVQRRGDGQVQGGLIQPRRQDLQQRD
jgi:hypothetical protein